jgi:hypothetical protein
MGIKAVSVKGGQFAGEWRKGVKKITYPVTPVSD